MGTDIRIIGTSVSNYKSQNTHLKFWATREQAHQRYTTCVTCEKITKIKTCELCNCFVIGKTKINQEFCPLNKW